MNLSLPWKSKVYCSLMRIPAPDLASFEFAKWVAIVTMAIDHFGKIVMPDVFLPTHLIGRAAFPLFVWIIASRLALRPELAGTYVRWLIPWALISQPAFVFAGREWYEANVMLTLLLGVLSVWVMQTSRRRGQRLVAILALALLGWFSDYGSAGVIAIPAIYLAATRDHRLALVVLAAFGILVNLPIESTEDTYAVLATVAAPVVAIASLSFQKVRWPRLPKVAFYAFYPAHLIVLTLLAQSFS